MKQVMCAMYDKKAECYLTPFVSRSAAEAVRSFRDAVKSEKAISDHAGDYDFYEIGHYDTSSGLVESRNPPLFLDSASAAVNFWKSGSGNYELPTES